MTYLTMIATILMFGVQTICFKLFNRSFMKNLASYFIFNFLYFGAVVLIYFAIGGIPGGIDTYTYILGAAFGAVFVVTILLYMKAMEIGPLSYSTMFVSFGLLIPIACGVLLWKEKVNALQIAGLVLLLASFYLCSTTAGSGSKGVNSRWVFLITLSFLGNGGTMALAREHQMLLPGKQVLEFLIIAFGTASLMSLVLFLGFMLKRQSVSHLGRPAFIMIVLCTGLVTAFGNKLTMDLNTLVSSVVLFPTLNGGVVILSTLVALIFLSEKISRRGIVGLGLGFVSMVLLSLK